MNKRIISKVISFFLSAAMLLTLLPIGSYTAFADSEVQRYDYDGYAVEYTIVNDWEGVQSISIKVINMGNEPMLNWCLKYNAEGEISNLYNAVIYSSDETDYMIKHNGYNYEIPVGTSTEFGYILSGTELRLPERFELCSKRIEKEEGYEAAFNVTNEWDVGFNGEFVVTNTSEKPIEAWTLAFDANFSIKNYWNCKMINEENGRYTIANQLWTTPIAVGESAVFGFTADKVDGQSPTVENIMLTEVVTEAAAEEVYDDFSMVGYIEYNEANNSLMIYWISEYEGGSFDIMVSNDGENFDTIDTVTSAYQYECLISEPFSKKYFKVRQTLENKRQGETEVLIIKSNENGYNLEFEDTDNDGMADYFEESFGLDVSKEDTDDDGLTDYQEMFLTGSDPTIFDSISSGISDSAADSDKDGISNIAEIENGTDPLLNDTDGDGLSDKDEITYQTNPLKADTDADGLSDGDEIAVGLNPNNPTTFGVPDSEYTFDVALSEDSEAVSEFNAANDGYTLSLDMKAAGNIADNLEVSESGYSIAMESTSMIGKPVEISYDKSCKVDSSVVKFKLDNNVVEQAEAGIESFSVFRMFEEYNVMLPIATNYDSEHNTISACADNLGTYCVMSLESLAEKASEVTKSEISVMSLNETSPMVYSASNSANWQNSINKQNINVVFVLDTRNNIDDETFENVKSNIIETAAKVIKESPKAKVFLILQHYDKKSTDNLGYTVLESKDNIYFTDAKEIYNTIEMLDTNQTDQFHKYCILSDAIKYIYDNCDNANGTYCFSIFDSTDVVYRTSLVGDEVSGVTESDDYGYDVLNRLKGEQIDVSVISNVAPEYNLGYAIDLYRTTGGIYIDGPCNFADTALEHIYGYVPDDEGKTVIYNGANFEKLELDVIPTKEYVALAEELASKLQTTSEENVLSIREEYSGYSDSDDDYVYDFEEIDVHNELIEWNNDEMVLPTLEDYCNAVNDREVTKAKNDFIKSAEWSPIMNISVMPLVSNPNKADTDDDGFVDYYEHMYNEDKNISTFSLNSSDDDTSPYYLDPMKHTKWRPTSEVARLLTRQLNNLTRSRKCDIIDT